MDAMPMNMNNKKKAVAQKMAAKKSRTVTNDSKKWDEYYGKKGYLTKDLKTLGLKAPKKPGK